VFFFAITGITLNHPEWFAAERITQAKGHLDPAWTNPAANEVSKREIASFLQQTHRLGGAPSDIRVDDQQCTVSFRGPGYTADVFIDRRTGDYALTETRLGLVAIINDLHKGRDTGAIWKAVIDISAALLVFISITGIVLIWFVHKHRVAGIVLLILGGIVSAFCYAMWVP